MTESLKLNGVNKLNYHQNHQLSSESSHYHLNRLRLRRWFWWWRWRWSWSCGDEDKVDDNDPTTSTVSFILHQRREEEEQRATTRDRPWQRSHLKIPSQSKIPGHYETSSKSTREAHRTITMNYCVKRWLSPPKFFIFYKKKIVLDTLLGRWTGN